MQTELTFENLVKFVLVNKKGKCFRGMTVLQIAYHLKLGLDENSLWFKEKNGEIIAMILARIDNDKKIVFIKENLSMCFENLQEFARKAKELYTGYTFHWIKRDRHHDMFSSQFFKMLKV